MSTDYAAKERAFVASLGEETGRDLAEWMAAINTCGCHDRNAIIDWLRFQGFQFSRASWLERIHHNRGQLIYSGETSVSTAPASTDDVAAAATPAMDAKPAREPAAQPASPLAGLSAGGGEIEGLLKAAKGLRPLAEAILSEFERVAGKLAYQAAVPYFIVSTAYPVAALHAGPKKIRVYADFGPVRRGRVERAEAAGKTPPPFPDMIVIDDARSIDAEFRGLIEAATRETISKTA